MRVPTSSYACGVHTRVRGALKPQPSCKPSIKQSIHPLHVFARPSIAIM